MTLIPITEKTQICFVDCGKEICECKPCKDIKDFIGNISSKDLDEDIKEIIDNNFDELL